MIGGQTVEYGQEDAYGHRKLGGIGTIIGEALKQITGIDIVNQQLAYLMRCWFTGLARPDGRAVVRQPRRAAARPGSHRGDGRAAERDVHDRADRHLYSGLKRVDVGELYDKDQYRARVTHLLGKPMFLY